MRRPLISYLVVLAALLSPAVATAAPEQPAGDFKNVEYVGALPDAQKAISIGFIRYEDGRDVMFVSTYNGIQSYDLTHDPAQPAPLGKIGHDQMAQPGDANATYFEDEDMAVDAKRKLLFFTRDATSNTTGNPGVFIIDAKDPAKLTLLKFQALPEGHTSTCIQECDFLWTAGLLARREIFATDVRDPMTPIVSPVPIDVGPFDQPAGTSHDVDVDAEGVAWVSGQGYLRGYWTAGTHKDPITGQMLPASPTMPVLYGGGKIPQKEQTQPDLGRFVHNSNRPIGPTASDGAPGANGNLVYWTEEVITECATAGEFGISSLEGALDTDATGDLKTLGTWGPNEKEGAGPGSCSAHWFTMRNHVVAQGYYANGTRFLDVSNPANPIQIAYFRPDDGVSWAAYWHGPYVYVADNARGVDILRVKTGAASDSPTKLPSLSSGTGCTNPVVALGRGLKLTRRGVTLNGRAAAAGCGPAPARVQVSFARVAAGKCAFLTAKRRLAHPKACTKPVWLAAKGSAKWRFAVKARLPKGSYTARIRALDARGNVGPERSFRLDADRRGRVKPREEVLAPRR